MTNPKIDIKPWYQASVNETVTFFDTNLEKGLTGDSAVLRLKRFGENINPSVPIPVGNLCKTTVVRNGKLQAINLHHVVLGDVVSLQVGNRVPADLRLFKVNNLRIDEAILGTSGLPSVKNTFAITKNEPLNLQRCMAFCGTFVTQGHGLGIVVANGQKVAYLPTVKTARSLKINRITRRLNRLGVVVGDSKYLNILPKINTIIFDANLNDKDIAEVIRKIQLIKNLPCKFIVSDTQAKRLQQELFGSVMAEASKLAKQSNKQVIDTIDNTQFIVKSNDVDILKLLRILRSNGQKVALVADGQGTVAETQVADLSIIISDTAKDDFIFRAGLILPKFDVSTISSIFHNRF